MNGPIRMYRTKQIIRHDLPVELPKCMYKMKNIHYSEQKQTRDEPVLGHVPTPTQKVDIFDQVKQFLQNSANIPEMAALEARQEQILQQLAKLKEQMFTIKQNLKNNNVQESLPIKLIPQQTAKIQQLSLAQQPDIIINASPTHPPYSLGIIQKLWQNIAHLTVTSHLHSSVFKLDERAANLAQALENFTTKNGVPKVNVRLIWKDVGANTQLIISQTPIIGEVNILRYLARISSADRLNYESQPNPLEVDSILDLSYRLAIAKTKTERASLLQTVNKALGKSTWLWGRTNVGIADVAAFSVIKQVCTPGEISVNLGKWMDRCENI